MAVYNGERELATRGLAIVDIHVAIIWNVGSGYEAIIKPSDEIVRMRGYVDYVGAGAIECVVPVEACEYKLVAINDATERG